MFPFVFPFYAFIVQPWNNVYYNVYYPAAYANLQSIRFVRSCVRGRTRTHGGMRTSRMEIFICYTSDPLSSQCFISVSYTHHSNHSKAKQSKPNDTPLFLRIPSSKTGALPFFHIPFFDAWTGLVLCESRRERRRGEWEWGLGLDEETGE